MLFFYSKYPYFVRTTKAAFWEDRERVKIDRIVSITHLSLGYENRRLQKILQ